jgi:DNA polymerase III subunit gamma/tau
MATTVPTRTPHQALYRRWRAQSFDGIVGQPAVVETLRNAVRLEKLSHGLLFVGPRGTGKTSMARIVAKAVNCLNLTAGEPDDACEPCVAIREGRALDVVELDAASNNRVDDMRELLPRVYTAPSDLRRKVFIIDEVQRIKEGWDVLLKTLEEPPDDVLFIFCTTDPSGIRPAVVSRLQRFTFRPLPSREIEGKLRRILEAEGRAVDDEAVALIASRAAGGMRDAESMLDQVLAAGADSIDAGAVRDLLGLADQEVVDGFVDALAANDPLAGVRLLDDLERDGRDLVAFAEQVIDALRRRLVAALVAGERGAGDAAALARAARRLSTIDANRGAAGGYRLQLELALLDGAQVASQSTARSRQAASEQIAAPTSAVLRAPPSAPRSDPARAVPDDASRAAPAKAAPADRAPAKAAPADRAPADRAAAEGRRSSQALPREPAAVVAAIVQPPEGAAPGAEKAADSGAPDGAATPPIDPGLEQLLAAWGKVVDQVGSNPANRPLIMACRPIEFRDNAVVLGFPEDQLFLRDIAERKRSVLEDGLSAVLGRRVAVRVVAANVELPDREPQADEIVSQARRVFAEDVLDVAEVD